MAPLLLFILLIPLHLQVNSQDLSSEQTILLSLKQHWDNPPSLRWWNSTSFVCDWPEVECLFGTVTGLRLAGNNIRGTIPSTICLLKNLVSINVSRNFLHGDIPHSLYNCSKLEILDLSVNELSGTIPVELLLHKRLRSLWLHGNRLVGEIPTPMEAIRLESLDLSHNYLNGSIPDDIKNLFKLSLLDLSMNLLGGTIPTELFQMRRLNYLSLAFNTISSQLPEQINMYRLQVLNLTHNNLYGTIPKGLHELMRLTTLDLSDNQLFGDIENVVYLRPMGVLRLCSNKFSGKVPREFVNQLFQENCLDRSNLCSDNRTKGLQSCPPSLCSVGNRSITRLEWPMRLHIAIGAAEGLCYMHHDCSPTIIHRDIKSRNILLDTEFNAKIADFGLSKLLTRKGDTETASNVAGTFGYIAPEYAYTTKVNRKTDVYSFGVVLLELTTGREAVTYGDHMNLAERAHLHYRDINAVIDALDDEIKDSIYLDQIIAVFRLGVICTATSPSNRPSMKDCLHILQNCRNNSS